MNKAKSRSALGNNPLSQGIFSKTVPVEVSEAKNFENQGTDDKQLNNQEVQNKESSLLKNDTTQQLQEAPSPPEKVVGAAKSAHRSALKSRKHNQESIKTSQATNFLNEEIVERVNLRLSVEINDWLDTLLKQGKRTHGRKIPKETWVQAALEFFRTLPVDWQTIDSEESLRQALIELESRLHNQESIKKNL